MKGWKKTGPMSWEPDPTTTTDHSGKIGHVVRYTNALGESCFGVIVDSHPAGLVEVYWDDYIALKRRIGQTGDASLNAHRSWTRIDEDQGAGARFEIFAPGTLDVRWRNAKLRDFIGAQGQERTQGRTS